MQMGSNVAKVALALVAMALVAAQANAVVLGPYGDTWDVSDGIQTGRMFRNNIPSTPMGRPFPGMQNTTQPYFYSVYEFFNAGPAASVNVTTSTNSYDTFFTAWSGSDFDPIVVNNIPNYLGDAGYSYNGFASFAFTAPADSPFIIVANTTDPVPAGLGTGYNFTVAGGDIREGSVAIPEPLTMGAVFMGICGLVRYARRR